MPPTLLTNGKCQNAKPKDKNYKLVRDSGLVHALLGIQTLDGLAGHPVAGTSWEGFVLETLLAALPWRSQTFFYRTAVGAEIDLVIERPDGKLWVVEIKRSLTAKLARGFYQACDDLKPLLRAA